MNRVIQLLTNLEAKIKAEGLDARKAREEFAAWCNTQSSDLTSSGRSFESVHPVYWYTDGEVTTAGAETLPLCGSILPALRPVSSQTLLASNALVTRKCYSSQTSSLLPDQHGMRRLHPQVFVRVVKRYDLLSGGTCMFHEIERRTRRRQLHRR